jgi:hypothetical protein
MITMTTHLERERLCREPAVGSDFKETNPKIRNFFCWQFFVIIGLPITTALAAETAGYTQHPAPKDAPSVSIQPFEPSSEDCWNLADKFSHPRELVAPDFAYPRFKIHSGYALGGATVLVQIDEFGFPRRLSVLSSTDKFVSKLAIEALEKARWWTEPNRFGKLGVWFYYRVEYKQQFEDGSTGTGSQSH